jgi:hypothetical protein
VRRLGKWLLAFLVLAGCACPCSYCSVESDVALTPADVIGIWRSDNYGDFGLLEFTDDGDFFAQDIQFLDPSSWLSKDIGTAPVAGSGQWALAPKAVGDDDLVEVELHTEVIGDRLELGGITQLDSRRDLGHARLSTFIGDPDEGHRVDFVKCGDCSSPVPGHHTLGPPAAATADQLAGQWRDDAGNTLLLGIGGSYNASGLLGFRDDKPQPSLGQWRVAAPRHDPSGPTTTVVLGAGEVLRIYATADGLVLATVSTDLAVHRQQVYRRVARSG